MYIYIRERKWELQEIGTSVYAAIHRKIHDNYFLNFCFEYQSIRPCVSFVYGNPFFNISKITFKGKFANLWTIFGYLSAYFTSYCP